MTDSKFHQRYNALLDELRGAIAGDVLRGVVGDRIADAAEFARMQQAVDVMAWEQELERAIAEWEAEGEPNQEEHSHAERLRALAESFHELEGRDGLRPWSPLALARMALLTPVLSGPSRLAAIFVLKLWNNQFPCPPFNALEACSRWDSSHRDAFVAWASDPFWP